MLQKSNTKYLNIFDYLNKILYIIIPVIMLMGFGANWVIQKAKNSHDIPIIKQVPDFAFHDQDGKPFNKNDATFGNGTQITFLTSSRSHVDKFHEIGLKAGGTSEGSGGERPEGSGVYYSYLRDLDGNKICAFTNSKE